MPENLSINILTFKAPKDNYTFYFTDAEDKALMRFLSKSVPTEVVEHFGEQKFYYTSFIEKKEGFFPVEKPVVPAHKDIVTEDGEIVRENIFNSAFGISVQKKFYHWKIAKYFKSKAFLVKSDYIQDTEVWIPAIEYPEEENYNLFDKFILRIQYKIITNQWELVIIYGGVSKIHKKSVSDLGDEIRSTAFKKIVYEGELYKYHKMPNNVARNLEKAFPVWNLQIARELNEVLEAPDKSNKYFKFKTHIDAFIKEYLLHEDFKEVLELTCTDLLKIPDKKIGTVKTSKNQLLFWDNKPDYRPLNGITNYGPFDFPRVKHIHFFYITHEDDRDVANLVHQYFNKEKTNFAGIEKYTGKPYHADKLLKFNFKNKENPWPEIRQYINDLNLNPDITYVAIYISPFSKDTSDKDQQETYYKIKQALLSKEVVCQVVDAKHARQSHQFVYNAVNMSIAINAKLNGTPWRLTAKESDELVVGVGAFHNHNTGMKYIASAFSFDNTGKFNRFDHFFSNQTRELAGSIKLAVKRYTSVNENLKRLVIHFYKKISQRELAPIERALNELDLNIPVFIVSINKTESTDYVAFEKDNPLLMPYSGTFINMAFNNYLLFNNSRYRSKEFKINAGYPFPLKIKITSNTPELLKQQPTIEGLLEQVYEFSRMYWKSFKQQSLPVTLKYSEMIASMVPYFVNHEIPEYGKDRLWFI